MTQNTKKKRLAQHQVSRGRINSRQNLSNTGRPIQHRLPDDASCTTDKSLKVTREREAPRPTRGRSGAGSLAGRASLDPDKCKASNRQTPERRRFKHVHKQTRGKGRTTAVSAKHLNACCMCASSRHRSTPLSMASSHATYTSGHATTLRRKLRPSALLLYPRELAS